MNVIALGIDASWTGLAVVALMSDGSVRHERFSSKPLAGVSEYERLDKLGNAFIGFIDQYKTDVLAIENYAFGSKFGREKAGELGGHLRWLLWQRGMNPLFVPPTALKSFVCDKGNAEKNMMMMHAFRRWGFEAPDDDTCDAFCLAQFALDAHTSSTEASRKRVAACERLGPKQEVKPRAKKAKKTAHKSNSASRLPGLHST